MRALVFHLIAWIGGLLGSLTAFIIVNRALREVGEARDRRRRAVIEPALAAAGAAGGSILDHLPKPLSRRDRRLAESWLLETARAAAGRAEAAREGGAERPETSRADAGGPQASRAAAFEALGAVDRAIADLGSAGWRRRAEAAERLGVMRSTRAVDLLSHLMGDDVAEVRMQAARALGLIQGTTAIRPLIAALCDPGRWSAIRVAGILAGAGAGAVDELLLSWDNLPRHARLSALDVLARSRSRRAAGLMRRCLVDPDADIRARAAHGLGLLGNADAAGEVQKALGDPEWPVRAMAAKALGRLGATAAVPALAEALRDRQWWVRANAGEALRHLGEAGRDALEAALGSADPFARDQAAAQLDEGEGPAGAGHGPG